MKKYFLALATALLLQLPSTVMADTPTVETVRTELVGEWLLTNPQDIDTTVVAGGMLICAPDDKEQCADGDVLSVILGEYHGNGCTDGVGVYSMQPHKTPTGSVFELYGDAGTVAVGTLSLHSDVLIAEYHTLVTPLRYKRSSVEEINSVAQKACAPAQSSSTD